MHPHSKKFYALAMFPYPSGAWLHVGHGSNYTGIDIVVRYKKMQGYNVINPIWRDSFWLPTENYAIKVGKPAYDITKENIDNFKKQLALLDLDLDRERAFATSDPSYYKWTQRIFSQLYKAGLVYKKEQLVNRDPVDQTVLANDQVLPDGTAERSWAKVIQKLHPQRFIKITDYADRLLQDLDTLDRPEETKTAQRNRIGRSEWVEIDFLLAWGEKTIKVFTTRADTVFGVTAVMLAPELTLIDDLLPEEYKQSVIEYRQQTAGKTAVQRKQDEKQKTWVFSGVYVTHPLSKQQIPVWFADYVLPDYATGSVMFVPAHDERDRDFYHQTMKGKSERDGVLPMIQVIKPIDGKKTANDDQISSKKSIYAIIKNPVNNTFLFNETWWLPWGWIEHEESRQESIIREIEEETWFTSDQYIFSPNYQFVCTSYYFAKDKNVHRENDVTVVQCLLTWSDSPASSHKRESHEQWYNFVWKTYDEIRQNFSDFLWFFGPLKAYTGEGVLINSGKYNNINNNEAKDKIIAELESLWLWSRKISYKLRDWSVSRQRYRWSPIPIYYDESWLPQLIPEEELPVILPLDLGNYKPAWKSPLADHHTFPVYHHKNGKTYQRECDTLDTFMCSSFYFLRFLDPTNTEKLIDPTIAHDRMPVDFYMGGKEHSVGHLLYARFIHKFLYDQWFVSCSEPFKRLFHQGMIQGEDWRKMSKRYGNFVGLEDAINEYGVDAVRMYIMFMWPLEQEKAWDSNTINGVKKFLERAERAFDFVSDDEPSQPFVHQHIKAIINDMETIKFNTVISKLMILCNYFYERKRIWRADYESFVKMMAPFATKLSQRLRTKLWHTDSVHTQSYPTYDDSLIAQQKITLAFQCNGKTRWTVEVDPDITQDQLIELIKLDRHMSTYLQWTIKKIIFVPKKIINVIVW